MVMSLQEDKYVDIYSNSSVRKIKHISRSVAVSSVKYISDSPVEETRMIIVAIKIVGTAQAVSTPVVTIFSATISLYLRRSLIKI